MVDDILNKIESKFINLIDQLEERTNDNAQYLRYVKKQFTFFQENGIQKDKNGVLKIYLLGHSLSRYADEFDWKDNSVKQKINRYLDDICELIIELDNEIS